MDAGRIFGRGIGFPPRIGPDGRWAWSEGGANVEESIRIILLTEIGERLLLETFGTGLRGFLFEPNTAGTRRLIEERVGDALRLWEPRIAVQSVLVEPDSADEQAALITIEYRLVATQSAGRLSLNVPLAG
ncbi:MAG TPA: GPW/gp25 family protein [Roseiflexaceae bacterium]